MEIDKSTPFSLFRIVYRVLRDYDNNFKGVSYTMLCEE